MIDVITAILCHLCSLPAAVFCDMSYRLGTSAYPGLHSLVAVIYYRQRYNRSTIKLARQIGTYVISYYMNINLLPRKENSKQTINMYMHINIHVQTHIHINTHI